MYDLNDAFGKLKHGSISLKTHLHLYTIIHYIS
jgi:hypothetical protein